jgi:hypothetical protein
MYHTPETLLNHVFEDLRKPKAPNTNLIGPNKSWDLKPKLNYLAGLCIRGLTLDY